MPFYTHEFMELAPALGTAERRFEVTRRMLELFAPESGLRLGLITKSDLILHD